MTRQITHTAFFAMHDWPQDCFLQGGHDGLVMDRSHPQGSYIAAYFFEAFPSDPATFIRGEGQTMEVAEDRAWGEWQQRLSCPAYAATGEHSFEARGYQNGAGFCSACNLFASKVFTGEDLGQLCHVCGVGTTWGRDTLGRWRCEAHMVHSRQRVARWSDLRDEPMVADPEEPDTIGSCAFCQEEVQDSAEGVRNESGFDSVLTRMAVQCPAIDMPAFVGDGVVPGRHALIILALETSGEGIEVAEVGLSSLERLPRVNEYIAVEVEADGRRKRALARVESRAENSAKLTIWWDFAILC